MVLFKKGEKYENRMKENRRKRHQVATLRFEKLDDGSSSFTPYI